MSNTSISIKTDSKTKDRAQETARELGLSLSEVINNFLKKFIKTKRAVFNELEETPNEKTRALLKQAEDDYKNGKASPAFKTGEEAVAWLEKQGI